MYSSRSQVTRQGYLVERAVHSYGHPAPANLVDEAGDSGPSQVGGACRYALTDVPHGPEVESCVGGLGDIQFIHHSSRVAEVGSVVRLDLGHETEKMSIC